MKKVKATIQQQGIWFQSNKLQKSVFYTQKSVYRFSGILNLEIFRSTLKTIISENEILRTNFSLEGNELYQIIDENFEISEFIEEIDLTAILEFEKRIFRAKEIEREALSFSFDLERDRLLKIKILFLGVDEYLLIILRNHIIFDVLSFTTFINRLTFIYNNNFEQSDAILVPLKQYHLYAEEQLKLRTSQEFYSALNFWKKNLNGFEDTISNGTTNDYKKEDFDQGVVYMDLSESISKEISTYTSKKKVFKSSLYNLAFNLLLNKFLGTNDILIGNVYSNRFINGENFTQSLGLFANIFLLRSSLDDDQPVNVLLKKINQNLLNAYRNSFVNKEDIYRYLQSASPNVRFSLNIFKEPDMDLRLKGVIPKDWEELQNNFNHFSEYELSFNFHEKQEKTEIRTFYKKKTFTEEQAVELQQNFVRLLNIILKDSEEPLSCITTLSKNEKRKILKEFNQTDKSLVAIPSIIKQIENIVLKFPERIALSTSEIKISYQKLNDQANKIAHALRENKVVTNSLIAVVMERIPQTIYCVVGILKSGGAYVPIEVNQPKSRIETLLELSKASHLIISIDQLNKYSKLIERNKYIKYVYCVNGDKCEANLGSEKLIFYKAYFDRRPIANLNTEISPESLAYTMFTSGTTGVPKGVLIRQQTVVNILNWVNSKFEVGVNDKLLFVTSIGFDLSVYDIFGTLCSGAELRLVSDVENQDPKMLFDVLVNEHITIWNSAPSVLQRLVPFITSNKYSFSDSKLRLVLLSGDWIPLQLPETLNRENSNIEVVSLGGATENTIWSNYFIIDKVDSKWISIPYGRPIQNVKCYILDKNLQICPIGVKGDLYIGGNCLAIGYLDNPDTTQQKFIPNPINENEIIYNTGDQARWFSDGNIEFLGRSDNQVKIRGHRIELEEIRNHLISHPKIKDAVVKDFGEKQDKYINGYFISDESIEQEELHEYLSSRIPTIMIPRNLIKISSIPITVNGKIDYRSLPNINLYFDKDLIKPVNLIEEKILNIFQEVLQQKQISVDSNFFLIGGHSLKAVDLLTKINEYLKVELTITDIFGSPTIKSLSQLVNISSKKEINSILKAPRKKFYNLTPSQRLMYITSQLYDVGTTYNIPQIIKLDNTINVRLLEVAVNKIIQRHEILRTSFIVEDQTPVQVISEKIEFELGYEKIDDSQLEARVKKSIMKFDISTPGLFRMKIFELNGGGSVLFLDFHHLIMDGVSLDIFYSELNSLYLGNRLEDVPIQFKDYSEWRQNQDNQNAFLQQKKYWIDKFSKAIEPLNLPLDFQRPAIFKYRGSNYAFEMDSSLYEKLKSFVAQNGLTMFTFLFGAFSIMLSKYSRMSDLIVGTANANRNNKDVMKSIGLFMNLVPLRVFPEPEKKVNSFFTELVNDVLQAFENQSYSIENIINEFEIHHDVSRNKLFDVLFVFQNIDSFNDKFLGMSAERLNFCGESARYDLTLIVEEAKGTIKLLFEYNTALFKEDTIRGMNNLFLKILGESVKFPDLSIGNIELLNYEERENLIESFNNTSVDYPNNSLIHSVFEDSVLKEPSKIAVYTDTECISYDELNKKANQFARHLLRFKYPKESMIAIHIERSIDMVVSILGILKAGYAYLPLSLDYPSGRINKIIEKSQAKILITKDSVASFSILNISFDQIPFDVYSDENLNLLITENNLAYTIFTSGSTGMPKGVMVEHKSVLNRIRWMQRKYPLSYHDIILQKTTYTFDVSVWELFWWMLSGSSMALLPCGQEKDPALIAEAIDRYGITTIHFVPSMLQIFLEFLYKYNKKYENKSLKYVFASGEELKAVHVEKFQKLFANRAGLELINLYGPTEATVDVSYYLCPKVKGADKVPIGKPIDNIELYIIDNNCEILPIGLPGELAISGVGVARGYINDEDLTNEKFINNPFKAGQRIYKSGDLARWLPNGDIEFLGRLDESSQIKIRGFRIELGEIENNLLEIDFVSNAVVKAIDINKASSQLVAYLVLDQQLFPQVKSNEIILPECDLNSKVYPNGMELYYINLTEADFMYKEIVEDNEYLKHDISLPPSACVIDIGANIGMFSRYINHLCPDADIYSFEPITPVFKILEYNAKMSNNQIKTFNIGVGSEDKLVNFTYYPRNTILSSSYGNLDEEEQVVQTYINNISNSFTEEQIKTIVQNELVSEKIECKVKTLSSIIKENDINQIHLLKIDVEKSEYEVLNGINENDWNKIDQLVIEIHNIENRLSLITKLLENKNFKIISTEQIKEFEGTNLYNLYAKKEGLYYPDIVPMRTCSDKLPSVNDVEVLVLKSLKNSLPEYMLPKKIVILKELPFLSNGKIDRNNLPSPVPNKVKFYPPRNQTDITLIKIWKSLLNIQEIELSIRSDYFRMGGNSLNATSMLLGVEEEFKVKVTLAEFYKSPRIESLTNLITSKIEKKNIEESEFKTIRL
ncbi:amino acid adenylation domain-containing protein [Sphingobacterium faecium]|uniref:amino acid adenylation domain-containing protein n=1 Tax=Sphingobacterium faecium TaxID=34087 RepID=UPI00320B6FF7